MCASPNSSATAAIAGHDEDDTAPFVEALFLIRFDQRVGYTIAWKRTRNNVALGDAVEYKSLPSGLHTVQSDLVYFSHEGYAGLSAFAKGDAAAEQRNANFVSVGVLVQRDGRYGRLGRVWLLAPQLGVLAAALAGDAEGVKPLEEFWEQQVARGATGGRGGARARTLSTASVQVADDARLPETHPARSILQYLDVFGPLVFRLQQAALLRKRILFVGSAPVRAACEFVYTLSVLSSVSPRDTEQFSPGTEDLLRLPSLFSVGVHDIPTLEGLRDAKHGGHTPGTDPLQGWVACTTDEILATKTRLYDIVVELPSTSDTPAQERRWPKIRTSDGSLVKASQRDVSRFRILHKELFKYRSRAQTSPEAYTDDDDDDTGHDTAPLLSRDEADTQRADDDCNESYDDAAVEPMTWTRLAYAGFMWWASAGEQDAFTTAERDADRELIGQLSDYSQSVETAIIACFHRQSSLLIQTLSQLVRDHGVEDHDDDSEDALMLDPDHLSRMGLDTWSEADRAFVQELGSLYFGRTVGIRGSEVDCCGLRVPVF